MVLTVLGTSSGAPTLRRMLPAAVLVREGEAFLFDCGEGTQVQLKRAGVSPMKISTILISHLHGDHINGLIGLLMSMEMDGRTSALHLWGPADLPRLISSIRRYVRTTFGYALHFHELHTGVLFETEEFWIEADELDHRCQCYGFAFQERDRPGRFDVDTAKALGVPPGPAFGRLQRGETFELADGTVVRPEQVLGQTRSGRRFAYVTDTRPCPGGVKLGYRADLLLHEATFAADLADKAIEAFHSTAREAAEIAVLAQTKRLALTHFSSRYLRTDDLVAEARERFPATIAAEDLMEIEIPRQDAVDLPV